MKTLLAFLLGVILGAVGIYQTIRLGVKAYETELKARKNSEPSAKDIYDKTKRTVREQFEATKAELRKEGNQ